MRIPRTLVPVATALALVFAAEPALTQAVPYKYSASGTATSDPAFVPLEEVRKIIASEGEIELGYAYLSEEKLRGDSVLPQPYYFLRMDSPVPLSALRLHLAAEEAIQSVPGARR